MKYLYKAIYSSRHLLQFLYNIDFKGSRRLMAGLVAFASCSLIFTYREIISNRGAIIPDPSKVIGWVLIDLVCFLLIALILSRKLFQSWVKQTRADAGSRLQNKIILTFTLIAIVPTMLVSIFSVYFFNFGIQSWFDKRVSTVLEQSINVAESYIDEHRIGLKDTAAAIAKDLGEFYYEFMHSPELFRNIVETQAEIRSLDEIMVFHASNNRIIAHSALSFSLAFEIIPMHIIERAEKGEVVEIKSDPGKIRMLAKISGYNDAYLLVGRLVDEKIIDYIDKTNGAAQEYVRLKSQINGLQIKFSIIFIIIAILLVVAAIIVGAVFATNTVQPIRNLVRATEKVKEGDLSVRVKEGPKDDEIAILSSAFNRMIKQLEHQQKDLVIAQRASAWADVARRVAHEIKNPLTPIQLSCEMLLRKFKDQVNDKEVFTRYSSTILRHAEEIRRIVAEFVDFAKLPSPKFELCNLVEIIKEFVESKKAISDKYIYNFICDIKSAEFMCDKVQIGQVLNNLVKNSEESLETSNLPEKIISLELTSNQQELAVILTDNGKGFPPDLLDKITEPYLTTRTKGTGLGLAIVKKIVEDHSGILQISNLESGGACVKLIFETKELSKKLK
jgi:two-component system nitrogen regulation sensor histidine kinase NtrY